MLEIQWILCRVVGVRCFRQQEQDRCYGFHIDTVKQATQLQTYSTFKQPLLRWLSVPNTDTLLTDSRLNELFREFKTKFSLTFSPILNRYQNYPRHILQPRYLLIKQRNFSVARIVFIKKSYIILCCILLQTIFQNTQRIDVAVLFQTVGPILQVKTYTF